jgi:hypothetical protein
LCAANAETPLTAAVHDKCLRHMFFVVCITISDDDDDDDDDGEEAG